MNEAEQLSKKLRDIYDKTTDKKKGTREALDLLNNHRSSLKITDALKTNLIKDEIILRMKDNSILVLIEEGEGTIILHYNRDQSYFLAHLLTDYIDRAES